MGISIRFLTFLIIISNICILTNAAKILAIFPLPKEAQFRMYETLMKGLVNHGHEVDVISYFPQKNKISRYNDYVLGNSSVHSISPLPVSIIKNYEFWPLAIHIFTSYGSEVCDRLFDNEAIIKIRKSRKKYDLLIAQMFGSDCHLGFAYLFNVPIIGIVADEITPWLSDRMGNPDNPSYIPNYLLPYQSKMNLEERVFNAISGALYKMGYQGMSLHPSELKSRKFFGPDVTPLDVLAYNTSLLLVNSHYSINFPRPNVPGIIEVAGIHISSPQTLSPTFNKEITQNKKFIFVILNSEDMTEKKIKILINALKNISKPIILRGNESKFGRHLPKNIYYDYFKVNTIDILCNENAAALITNGDLFFMQEAVYCGVPIIGLPLTAEHEVNVQRFTLKGIAANVNYENLEETVFTETIEMILKNTTYKKNAERVSGLFRDRPMKPLDTAIFWVEYVLRHSGAPHLRTVGADLIWMEYYNIDVVLVIITIFLLFAAFIYLLRFILNKLIELAQNKDTKKLN